ncbi:Cilia- And Flagella-Associated Protein 44 [Manis pentadactyla]|nr:Cilia- And Flagella-Associated Protein 44 [Manis pentadactyla]
MPLRVHLVLGRTSGRTPAQKDPFHKAPAGLLSLCLPWGRKVQRAISPTPGPCCKKCWSCPGQEPRGVLDCTCVENGDLRRSSLGL